MPSGGLRTHRQQSSYSYSDWPSDRISTASMRPEVVRMNWYLSGAASLSALNTSVAAVCDGDGGGDGGGGDASVKGLLTLVRFQENNG
eukprot:CAMPEP_0182600456 /NCGR_PEP_ID=MMETSP1324-20130603/90990_1 /TAXON_ID=236786 /ORGANISM="Florenciella sp., Strain RCC1587" /LENGTH=87 /DNA_ID=CAMNT_0024818363 /DNA_START=307 /DNA_END=571 /DNA_ORIENTATION=-